MLLIFEHLKIDNINMSSIKLTVLITDALFHTLFQAVTLYYFLLSLHWLLSFMYWGWCRSEGLWRHEHTEQTSMESSFNAVELRELRGGGGRRGVSPTPPSAPWVAATAGCVVRGFENASYQQDDEPEHHYQQQQGATVSAGCPPSTSGNDKVSHVLFCSHYFCY